MTADTITAIKKALEVAETLHNYTDIDVAEGANPDVVAASYAAVNTIGELLSTLESLQRENEELREDRDRTARNRDMYKGQVERQAVQIEDFRSETKRLQIGVYVETIPAVHLISVFADDMNERNWDDKRAYIKQQADRIRTALASTGGEHHAE